MRSGDEVRVSTPVSTASAIAKPGICRSKAGKASRIAASTAPGRLSRPGSARSVKCTPGVYDGSTLPNSRAHALPCRPATKSPTSWPGAW